MVHKATTSLRFAIRSRYPRERLLLDDCSGMGNAEAHEGALKNIAGAFGVVCNAADVIETWTPAAVPAGV